MTSPDTPSTASTAPAALRPFLALAGSHGPVGRAVAALAPAAALTGAHVLTDGGWSTALAAAAGLAVLPGTCALAWAAVRAERAEQSLRAAHAALSAAAAHAEQTATEHLAEQVRGAFVQLQFTERQSRVRAQEVVDDSSATIVERLAEVEGQVASVQSSTDVIDERALAAANATREILARAAQADRDVAALEDSLRSVGSMATVIAQVAGQTKLLALNATIEAARAGAAGDGFRVVAGEVKDLAATTAGSTGEITETVAAVQADAHAVLRSLRAVQERIASIDEAAEGLRSVADSQRGALVALQGSVAAAVEGARAMGDLAATLERRRVDRFPCRQDVLLRVEGHESPATVLDLGLGGARVATRAPQRIGVGTRVVVPWPQDGRTLELAGAVARATGSVGAWELGVVFDTTSSAAPAALVAVVERLRSTCPVPPAR
ncbi:methyl-accepting chemotaxis protein [Kineococcus sp. TBRC 1896]|uniref:Methyl-accepting chemotaxis protein n=1 Tax=Kineococcus mangrovi TaxID=1660183 RepID=A0ABV4I1Y1_9ACTN